MQDPVDQELKRFAARQELFEEKRSRAIPKHDPFLFKEPAKLQLTKADHDCNYADFVSNRERDRANRSAELKRNGDRIRRSVKEKNQGGKQAARPDWMRDRVLCRQNLQTEGSGREFLATHSLQIDNIEPGRIEELFQEHDRQTELLGSPRANYENNQLTRSVKDGI